MVDLYVKNGKSVTGEPLEVTITDGKISAMGRALTVDRAKETLDVAGRYLSAGWIDDHTHCYEKLTLYYDDPDEDGVKTGVTTVIDAGSTGADNIGDFYQITRSKKTNVLAMINISKTGILAQDELGDMNRVQWEPFAQAVADYPDFIVGIKARESHSVVVDNDVKPLAKAKEYQQRLAKQLPIMVHVGANPPELKDILALMTKGDILTHAYNGKPNGMLTDQGQVKSFVTEAYQKGIIFDVGHGTDSYNFNTGEVAIAAGLIPKSISTDIYHRNRENGPVFNMATTLEKMMLLGFDLATVIKMVTAAPADNFKLSQKGQLKVGLDGDLTVFEVQEKPKQLTDSNGNQRTTNQVIVPTQAIVAGKVYQTEVEA
ncbi:amidohydrolase/deacetylase family metallohydrolase [Lactiplantibacillus mudanjiangensis]|uniref:Amidohydrolase/deacetylase family metallohydrolase [Lactobacillus pentosus] n=1 Tax=Lactiplantibacillus mudanjiangensis TaxID=1296538 RepID=A0A660DVE8_9LACO|nr:amidohydrolase/deacetylase family metallohydrolase [Lactiplantibacillus mudanjiangensis]VDG22558.1 amidohydrolase/deacetylase family metallohydrolase [Lactobacillus pentosus] [Lactiplantibacillus mudanjiangensis]VDG26907.1 amidohydrolase/deacetylase family metallohydrolase [Lactobacillus pentosus] [Lactiplantibacillus mudanjiangensis]